MLYSTPIILQSNTNMFNNTCTFVCFYLLITGGCDGGPLEFQLHPRVHGCCLCASAA